MTMPGDVLPGALIEIARDLCARPNPSHLNIAFPVQVQPSVLEFRQKADQ
jgi:hypothetical protein